MIDFRCSNCNKLLGKIDGRAEIKCPKCKMVNNFPKPIRSLAEYDFLLHEDGWVYTSGGQRIGWVKPKDRDKPMPQLWSQSQ